MYLNFILLVLLLSSSFSIRIDKYSVKFKHREFQRRMRSINDSKFSKLFKPSFDHISIYYDVHITKNGILYLIPKDLNQNHYFIG